MNLEVTRRKFLGTGVSAAAGALLSRARAGQDERPPVRVAVIGTGGRGTGLLSIMLGIDGCVFPALCDINPTHLGRAQSLVEEAGRPKPEGYSDGDHAFEKLLARGDLDAVIIATPWQWHTPMAVYAMKNGVRPGVEVPCALSLDECWALVDTSEQTGVPCMMLENWSFRRDNLAVLNMIRKGLLGEMVHCHCAHSHDCIDHWFFDAEGNDRWPAEFLIRFNRDQYPTHSLGPVLSWMDINRGDAFATLTSTATDSRGINAYFARRFGPDHPGAQRIYKQGDIVTTVIRTHGGKTIVINYDMQLPRPYDNRWLIQGTLGIYNEQREAVYIVGRTPDYHEWEPFAPYQAEFDHSWWRDMTATGGHGGTDVLELARFLDAVRAKTQPPIDVYDSVTMSCVVALSEQSIAKGSAPVECPDFTRGKWKQAKPVFAVEA
ncbi:MAG TPA: Gfo/Idh/MocA family oxidoreductase [Candidatus Hydrogenedentes bacterium]|nr:Gfo/Idh/MocA family oxidoreductase [Candidatus Hydrogenedentota bacterium]